MSQTHHRVVPESTVPEKCVHGVHKGANVPEEQESEQVCSLCDLCCVASDAAYNTTLLQCIILIIVIPIEIECASVAKLIVSIEPRC